MKPHEEFENEIKKNLKNRQKKKRKKRELNEKQRLTAPKPKRVVLK